MWIFELIIDFIDVGIFDFVRKHPLWALLITIVIVAILVAIFS